MTFNLAARQKPRDISPNWITACSSPSSHNFQLDSLTAARSARFTACNSPAAPHSHRIRRKTCSRVWEKREEASRALFFKQSTSSLCSDHRKTHTGRLLPTINYFNARAVNFISGSCNVNPCYTPRMFSWKMAVSALIKLSNGSYSSD